MNNIGLSGKLLPLHLKPKDDELLTSWIVRLALAHALTPTTFDLIFTSSRCARIWAIQDIDLNKMTNDLNPKTSLTKLFLILSKKTATPLRRVKKTTLDEYDGRLYFKIFDSRLYSWLVQHNLNIYLGKRRFGMQACAKCLSEDKEPYFRRTWRFAFVVVCPRHNCFLIDRCPNCFSPILFHRAASYMLHVPMKAMTTCYKCWFDIRDTPGEESKTQKIPRPEVVNLQTYLTQIAKQRYIKINGIKAVPTVEYFNLLHWLLNTIIQPYPAISEIQFSVFKYFDFKFNIPKTLEYCTLESLDISERYKLVWLLHHFLSEHPDKYVQFCKPDNLLKRIWMNIWRTTPIWYLGVMKAECNQFSLVEKYRNININGSEIKQTENNSNQRNKIHHYEQEEQRFFGKSAYAIKREKEFSYLDYLHEFKPIAVQLYSDGVLTRHVARILNVDHQTTWEWIKEYRSRK